MPIARVPQIPHVRCTEIAPTGSSILIRSNNITEKTAINDPCAGFGLVGVGPFGRMA